MYELFVLSQLMLGPGHGYKIAKIISDAIGPYARLSPGRLYPLLTRLEQSGLIEVDPERAGQQQGDRQLRIYRITEAGRERWHWLMMDTSMNLGDYQRLFSYKVSAFGFLTPAERLRLIDHYITYCQAHIVHIQTEIEDLLRVVPRYGLNANPSAPKWDQYTLDHIVQMQEHRIDQWRLELDWAVGLREREMALAEQGGAEAEEARAVRPEQ